MRHKVEKVELKNGMRGLLVHVPNASVMNIKVQFRAGMRYAKSPEVSEIAHVVEHLSFGANAKFKDEQDYEAEFTKNGAYHNAGTSDFSVCYETECADFEWERILKLKEIAITSPRFNDEELKSEKGNVRAELTGYLNDYYRLIWPKLQSTVGETVPTLRTRLETVSNIELKDIREHYRRTHTSSNMRFIIVGKIRGRKHKILKMLENWDLKYGHRFEIPEDELHSGNAVLIRRKDANNITFGFSFFTPRHLSTRESRAFMCLNHILTGTMSSRIFGQARKRGLVYDIESNLSNSTHNASWDFDGEVNEENSEELFDLIRKELEKILNGHISDKDIEAAKSYALGRYQMSAQTVGQIADYYAENYFMSEEIEDYAKVPDIIKSLKKSDLVELAREFAASGISGFVAVGSCEKPFIENLAEKLKL